MPTATLRLSMPSTVTPPSEALLISRACDVARGSHADLTMACNGPKAAQQAAADQKARESLPQNTADQVTEVMRRVAALNDRGQAEDAGAEIDMVLATHDARKFAPLALEHPAKPHPQQPGGGGKAGMCAVEIGGAAP